MYTRDSAILSRYINRIITDQGSTLGSFFKPTFSEIIEKLFKNGEQGFFYDPNDLSTMYQDAAGTIPVTAAGQPVELVLDKSKGLSLSAEMFTAPLDFNKWGRTAAVTSFTANSFTTNGLGGCVKNPIITGMSPTKAYQVRIFGTCNVAHKIRRSSSVAGEVSVPAGDFDVTIKSPITFADNTLYFQLQVAGTITVNSISVKEIAGNHAHQTTSAARPILRDTPRRIDFDAVDDKLITNIPTQLTGCTVVRAVPNVGTQILTNQTIPTTYNDNTDHCGLLVINRVLTPNETSAITNEFNKRAGV